MILHWPRGIKNAGRFSDKFSHLYDVMPTVLELSGGTYPDTFEGKSGRELYGDSFVGVIKDQPLKKREPIYMERGSFRYLIDDGYKLLSVDGKKWSLYNLEQEETEITEVSKKEAEIFHKLLKKFEAREGQFRK